MNTGAINTDKIQHTLFSVQLLKNIEQSHPAQFGRQHTQTDFEIIWLLQGSGIHYVNELPYELDHNCMHCVIPGQQHQLSVDVGSQGYIISFNELFINSSYEEFNVMEELGFFRFFSQSPALHIPNENVPEMEELIVKLIKENGNLYLSGNEILSKYLKIFFIYIRRHFKSASSAVLKSNNKLLNSFLWLLENNFKEKKSVSDYASELCLSASYLNHVIKKTTGYPASHHIQHRIVLEAKRKVRQTGASMKEVAYYLGFDDIAHFSKYFKSTSGMNFTTFKNESLAEFTM